MSDNSEATVLLYLAHLCVQKNVSGLQVQVHLVSDQRYTTGAHKVAASVCSGSVQLAAYA